VSRLDLVIESLGKHHDRARFSCGQPDLDNWFRLRASQDEKRNVTRVFVATTPDLGVVGFYSLSSLSLALESLPGEIAHKLPRYDAIPAALIGRLARDERVRGQGVGELLVADAIQRILGAGLSIAVFAIVVDAKDERAVEFYKAFGFRMFPLQPRRLFLLTATAATGLQAVNRF
jgi:GNAT superfamily N-acetyltransferase